MPSFDAGYYSLTSLIPLLPERSDPLLWRWQPRASTPVHSLRELLDSLRSVDVPELPGEDPGRQQVARPLPFSGNPRTHFARLVVVEDIAYNGRQRGDTLLDLLRGFLPALQAQERDVADHLPCSYLLVLLDFDCPDGSRGSVEAYLNQLWHTMEQEWTLILRHCIGYELNPCRRRQSFLSLILRHEIESTFSFCSYNWAAQAARRWRPGDGLFAPPRPGNRPALLLLATLPLLLALVLLIAVLIQGLAGIGSLALAADPIPAWRRPALLLLLAGLILTPVLLWPIFLRRANQPWPAQVGTDLRAILKALYLQGRFLQLAEDWQNRSGAPEDSLRQTFRSFLEEARPHDLRAPTLRPGRLHAVHPGDPP